MRVLQIRPFILVVLINNKSVQRRVMNVNFECVGSRGGVAAGRAGKGGAACALGSRPYIPPGREREQDRASESEKVRENQRERESERQRERARESDRVRYKKRERERVRGR